MATPLSLAPCALRDRRALVMEAFETHFERLYRFARRSLDGPDAEAVTQQVFIRLLSFENLEKKDLTPACLHRIAESLLRRRARATPTGGTPSDPATAKAPTSRPRPVL